MPQLNPQMVSISGRGTDASNLGLWRVALEAGEPVQVLDSLFSFNAFDAREDGVYFIPRPDPSIGYTIRFLDFATGRIKTIAEIGKEMDDGFSVSPDRRWALYGH